MPLTKAKGYGKKATGKAVSKNISELTKANKAKPKSKKRSRKQIAAIANAAAKS